MVLSRMLVGMVLCSGLFSLAVAESCAVKKRTSFELTQPSEARKSISAKSKSPQQASISQSTKSKVVVVHRETCPHCRHLMQEVFSSFESNSKKFGLNADVDVQFLDTDQRKDLDTYLELVRTNKINKDVQGVPAVIILGANGQEQGNDCRIIGYRDAENFFKDLSVKIKHCG